jgi:hypothetical protein
LCFGLLSSSCYVVYVLLIFGRLPCKQLLLLDYLDLFMQPFLALCLSFFQNEMILIQINLKSNYRDSFMENAGSLSNVQIIFDCLVDLLLGLENFPFST